jgi:hypothetical protein
MNGDISFLTPTINSVRKSIKGIDDSYNNFWDILAELVQNSVDAINAKNSQKGKIDIYVNAIEKSIRIIDDGIGIKHDEIPKLLSPFSTNKENDINSIGEKGVGLKFVIFESTNFVMKTKSIDEEKGSIAKIENAKVWKNNIDEEDLKLNLEYEDLQINGTDIYVGGVDGEAEKKIFNMNFNTLKFIARTKTAIGNVLNIFSSDNSYNIDVNLTLVDLNGEKTSDKIPYKYWLPIENVKNSDKLDLDDYNIWLSERDRSDNDKRNKLKNKVIYCSGEIMHNDVRPLKWWVCFVPKREIWNKLSVSDGLLNEDILDDEEKMTEKNLCFHQAGIFTSVKGMPTGITLPPPSTGQSGYWSNLFVIIEDKQLKFDIGRKSINSAVQSMYQKHLKNIFNNVTSKVYKYIAGDPEPNMNTVWDRDNIKTDIESLPPLGSNKIHFEKLPNEQEASVAAIFYELIGAGKIEGISPVISGYRNRYDLYAHYKNHFVIMEFKSHLRNIIKDFDNLVKLSNEVDYIVCWDVNDDDKTELHNSGLTLEKIEDSDLFKNTNDEYLRETTHKIIISNSATPVYVIDLKILVDNI